jgi:hypothetical protein
VGSKVCTPWPDTNADLPGADIQPSASVSNVVDVNACAALCAQHPDCFTFTYASWRYVSPPPPPADPCVCCFHITLHSCIFVFVCCTPPNRSISPPSLAHPRAHSPTSSTRPPAHHRHRTPTPIHPPQHHSTCYRKTALAGPNGLVPMSGARTGRCTVGPSSSTTSVAPTDAPVPAAPTPFAPTAPPPPQTSWTPALGTLHSLVAQLRLRHSGMLKYCFDNTAFVYLRIGALLGELRVSDSVHISHCLHTPWR